MSAPNYITFDGHPSPPKVDQSESEEANPLGISTRIRFRQDREWTERKGTMFGGAPMHGRRSPTAKYLSPVRDAIDAERATDGGSRVVGLYGDTAKAAPEFELSGLHLTTHWNIPQDFSMESSSPTGTAVAAVAGVAKDIQHRSPKSGGAEARHVNFDSARGGAKRKGGHSPKRRSLSPHRRPNPMAGIGATFLCFMLHFQLRVLVYMIRPRAGGTESPSRPLPSELTCVACGLANWAPSFCDH